MDESNKNIVAVRLEYKMIFYFENVSQIVRKWLFTVETLL